MDIEQMTNTLSVLTRMREALDEGEAERHRLRKNNLALRIVVVILAIALLFVAAMKTQKGNRNSGNEKRDYAGRA